MSTVIRLLRYGSGLFEICSPHVCSGFRMLGTAMDFIRFDPRRYAVISGRLGTSVDFIRYILRRCFDLWRIIAGKLLPVPKRLTEAEIHGVQRLGSCFLCLNGLLKQKSMEYVGWKQASCA